MNKPTCAFCNKLFVSMVTLTLCGHYICYSHLEVKEPSIKCLACPDNHDINIQECLELLVNKRNRKELNLTNKIKDMKINFAKYEHIQRDPCKYIEEKYAQLSKEYLAHTLKVKSVINRKLDEYLNEKLAKLSSDKLKSLNEIKEIVFRLNQVDSVWQEKLEKFSLDILDQKNEEIESICKDFKQMQAIMDSSGLSLDFNLEELLEKIKKENFETQTRLEDDFGKFKNLENLNKIKKIIFFKVSIEQPTSSGTLDRKRKNSEDYEIIILSEDDSDNEEG